MPDGLVARIQEAFADVWCPVELTSGPIGWLHDPLSHFQHEVLNWPDFTVDRAYRYFELLEVFTPEAWRFYLPRFLVAAIDEACNPQVTEALIGHLVPPSEHSLHERVRFEALVGTRTAQQVDAVRQFLRFIADRDAEEDADADEEIPTPQRALDRYWSHA
jgi:hypothetical protein